MAMMPPSFIPPEVHGQGRFRLRRRDFTPAYLKTYAEGRLRDKVEEALSHLGPSCQVCPRLDDRWRKALLMQE